MGYDFSLSESQALLQNQVRRTVEDLVGWEAARIAEDEPLSVLLPYWEKFSELGWAGLCGSGGGRAVELVLLGGELGRRAIPLPLITHNACLSEIHSRKVPGDNGIASMTDGKSIVTLAHFEASDSADCEKLSATFFHEGGDIRIQAEKAFVPFATMADYFVVTGRMAGTKTAAVLVPTSEVKVLPYTSTGRDGRATIAIDSVFSGDAILATGTDVNHLVDLFRLGTAGFIAGAAREALQMTIGYVKERVVFGRPLGSFQAVQHRLVDMLYVSEALDVLLLEAAWLLDRGDDGQASVDAACAFGASAAQDIIAGAHQLHGAIGFTFEHNLGLLSTAVQGSLPDLGREEESREAVAMSLGV